MTSRLLASAALCLAVVLPFAGCSLDWNAPPEQTGAGGGATTSTGTMGTTTTSGPGSGGGGGMSGTGGAGVGGGTGGAPATECAATPPQEGTACNILVSRCWYGDDVRPECRLDIRCQTGNWNIESSCNCPPADDPQCPDNAAGTPPTCVAGTPLLCQFADGTHCGCIGATWVCPPTPAGCPNLAPNAGQPCNDDGLQCSYGECALSTAIQINCDGGTWKREDPGCNNVPVPGCN